MDGRRSTLEQALAGHGLRLRGGWVPAAQDALSPLPADRTPAVVWMVGQVGSEVWPAFSASPQARDGLPDPMDRWSKQIGDALAAELGGRALYPSDGPPWHPFQQWAARAEPLQPSPLLMQIHPEHGLWHAYRFALALPLLAPEDAAVLASVPAQLADICARCSGQPCLSACPVDAFAGSSYRVDACAAHLHLPQRVACRAQGCQARRACPVGVAHRYVPGHAAFHMAAFAARHPADP
jgi:hypothetical protein